MRLILSLILLIYSCETHQYKLHLSGEELVVYGASDYEVVGVLKSDPPTVLIMIYPGDVLHIPICDIKPRYADDFYISCGEQTVYYEGTDIYAFLEKAGDR